MESGFKTIRIEFIIPLFAGVLLSLYLCVFLGFAFGYFTKPEVSQNTVVVSYDEDKNLLFSSSEKIVDPVSEYFKNPEYKEWVIVFFTGICSSREIAQAILANADRYDVPPALAFALCWEESRFNPRAINRGNRDGSVDRGLFQLNNRSFPNLEIPAFYDIEQNARNGISYLRQCIDSGGSIVSALAMYNAGAGRVRSTGAPHVTLNYVNRILDNRVKIESRFLSRLIHEEETRLGRN